MDWQWYHIIFLSCIILNAVTAEPYVFTHIIITLLNVKLK